jgi:hypothetical protein
MEENGNKKEWKCKRKWKRMERKMEENDNVIGDGKEWKRKRRIMEVEMEENGNGREG